MERIAAIVEGHTEEYFVRITYGAARVARAIPNGRTVAPEVIVDAIVDALELIAGNITKVLILFDREKRGQSADDLASVVRAGVAAKCAGRELCIGVSDIQIENWVLADELEMKARFDAAFVYPGDGTPGKSVLRALKGGVSLGPKDTAELLKVCSASRGAANSKSLATLLGQVNFDWAWAKS